MKKTIFANYKVLKPVFVGGFFIWLFLYCPGRKTITKTNHFKPPARFVGSFNNYTKKTPENVPNWHKYTKHEINK